MHTQSIASSCQVLDDVHPEDLLVLRYDEAGSGTPSFR